MTTTNRYQPPFTSRPIKPSPWRNRHFPPFLYRLPITHILLLFTNTSSSLHLNHIVRHPIHFRLNLRYPKSTALGRHRPHLLQKNTTSILHHPSTSSPTPHFLPPMHSPHYLPHKPLFSAPMVTPKLHYTTLLSDPT